MSTDKRNAPSDIPIEHAENGTVSATNGAQSGAINDKCMSEGKLTIVVVTLAILTFLGILSETSLNIAYSALMEEFAISADVVQWLTTGYLLLLSVAIPTSPFMVRKFPTKALFVMAIALFSVGTLVGALALNFPMLLAARLIMALGTGVSLPLLTNIILDKAPFHKRGMMLGLVSLVTCAAPAIGPVFGGLVMEFLNWHWIFYAMIPFLVISFVLGAATGCWLGRHYCCGQFLRAMEWRLAILECAYRCHCGVGGVRRIAVAYGSSVGGSAYVCIFGIHARHGDSAHVFRRCAWCELLAADSAAARIGAYVDDGRFDFAAGRCDWRGVGSTDRRRVERAFPAEVHRLRFCWRGGSHEGAIAVAYALFMAASGFVLVPDQAHALNQLPSSMNADGSAVMNTMQQLAGAIGTAVASTLISEFSAANVNAGMQQADAYVAGFSTSMWVFFGMAVCGEILALLMFRFSVKRAQE